MNHPQPAEPPRPAVAERITVALIPKAAGDMRALQDRTGLSKTDLVNRAITLYEFVDARLGGSSNPDGWDLLIRNRKTKGTQQIRLL